MKTLSTLAASLLKKSEPHLVHHIAVIGGWRKLDKPTPSNELLCLICDCKEHYAPICFPEKNEERVWICANAHCDTTKRSNMAPATLPFATSQRARQWPEFCVSCGIGNMYHDVKFESIDQSHGKIEYLLKFCKKPSGIILMQGPPGTGKTYAALGACEMFTRRDTSCFFITAKMLTDEWVETFKSDKNSNYVYKLKNIAFLVIDDFGMTEMSSAFLSFLADLINSRMQWTDKGTIITTNLDSEKLSGFCGNFLSDRLQTGQKFVFKGQTRRQRHDL